MTNIEKAFLIANKVHANQSYDIYPYIYHLTQVYQIAKDLGYDEAILIGCILHDAIEDGNLSYNDIKNVFGEEVAEIVFAVTDELGRNRKERKEKTYPKIKANWKATVVKICDRIGNIEHSKINNQGLFKMYIKESDTFIRELDLPIHPADTQRAWTKLKDIIHGEA